MDGGTAVAKMRFGCEVMNAIYAQIVKAKPSSPGQIERPRSLRKSVSSLAQIITVTAFIAFVSTPLAAASADAPPGNASANADSLPAKSIYELGGNYTTDQGKPFSLSELRGEPVVLTLFYTSCQSACPRMVEEMQRIEKALPAQAAQHTHFVLISFDPDTDTVSALKAYREAHGLGAKWILVRGSSDDVRTLAMILGVQYKQEGAMFAHSNLVSILNKDGELAFQRSGFSDKIDDFLAALGHLR